MRRVMIVGQPGSGKSTFARQLGAATGLPVVHIDRIHWQPGWVERSRDEKDRLTRAVHARETWIFEGGHSRTWPERLARADTLIWLDVPLPRRLWRVLRRAVTGLRPHAARHAGRTARSSSGRASSPSSPSSGARGVRGGRRSRQSSPRRRRT